MIINHNLNAMNSHRQLGINTVNAGKSMEKLSSGLRINRAGDDAAGLAISEKMRSQIRGLDQASRNSQDAISLIQTAEGALNETHSMLQRMRELVVQANNGTNLDSDRKKIQDEIKELKTEITNIANNTQFNSQNLLDGTFGAKTANVGSNLDGGTSSIFELTINGAKVANDWTVTTGDGSDATPANNFITVASATLGVSQTIAVTDITAVTKGQTFNFEGVGVILKATATDLSNLAANNTFEVTGTNVDLQVGANAGQQMNININAMDATSLGVGSIDVSQSGYNSTQFDTDINAIDNAITKVSEERSKLGAYQNRLEHTIANLGTSSENLTAAESRIRDVDMAKEMMQFSKNNILAQAAQAMLAQANQQPQGVLQLLR